MNPLSLKESSLLTESLTDPEDIEADLRREEDRQASILIPLLLLLWWRSGRLTADERDQAERAQLYPDSALLRAQDLVQAWIRDRLVPGLLEAAQRGSDSARDHTHRSLPVAPFSRLRTLLSIRFQARGFALAQGLTESQRQNLGILMDALIVQRGLHPRAAVRIVERALGLTERQQASLVRHIQALQAGGLTGRLLEQAARRYTQQALRQRAERVVRTETVAAFNEGTDAYTREVLGEAGIPSYRVLKRWHTSRDERVCRRCFPMHGVTVPADQPFQVPRIPTRKNRNPGFDLLMLPPAHAVCRCIPTWIVLGGLADAANPLT